MARVPNVIVRAVVVEVVCPHCQTPQPNPRNWRTPWSADTLRDVLNRQGARPQLCITCGEPFRYHVLSRVPLKGE